MASVVTLGEILMRLSPPGDERIAQATNMSVYYGGSEANISAALAQWNVSSAHITALPKSQLGDAVVSLFKGVGVDMAHVQFASGRIGQYFFEPGVSLRSPAIIYDRANSCFANLQPEAFDWDKIFADTKWFHWSGITPAISQQAAYACKAAIEAAKKKGIIVSGDINYRRNLWQYGKTPLDIMPELIANTDVIVGGTEDFKNCTGIYDVDFEKSCAEVAKKFPNAKMIATTFRETANATVQSINAILWKGGTTVSSRTYELNPIVDRIGTGDAFMAGLIYARLNGKSPQDTIDFAAASCAFKHTVKGDILRATLGEIEDLVNNRNIGKLLR